MSEIKLLLLCDDPFIVTDITWCARRAGFAVLAARFQELPADALVRVEPAIVLMQSTHAARTSPEFQREAAARETCVLTFDIQAGRQEITIAGKQRVRVELRAGKEAAFYAAIRKAADPDESDDRLRLTG